MSDRTLGYGAAITSAVVFGTMPLMALYIYARGGNAIGVTFYRYLFSLPMLLLLNRRTAGPLPRLSRLQWKQMALVAIFGYGPTGLLLYISYDMIPTGIATTVHFLYPVLVVLGGVLFTRVPVTRRTVVAVVCSTVGVVLFYGGGIELNVLGFVLALLSAVTYAFYILYIDASGLNHLPTYALTFYLTLISGVITFFYGLFTDSLFVAITPAGWIMTLVLTFVVAVAGVSFFQVGIRKVGPQHAAILSTFEPVTSVVIGILVFAETVTPGALLGVVFILLAVVLIATSGRRQAKRVAALKRPTI